MEGCLGGRASVLLLGLLVPFAPGVKDLGGAF